MKLLLDTLVVIWLLQDSHELGIQARTQIHEAEGVWVSAITLAEIEAKSVSGKVTFAGDMLSALEASGLAELPLTWVDAAGLNKWLKPGGDFIDVLLIAQCERADLKLLTADSKLLHSWPELTMNAKI